MTLSRLGWRIAYLTLLNFHRVEARFYKFHLRAQGVTFGRNLTIGGRVSAHLEGSGKVVLGEGCVLGAHVSLATGLKGSIRVGDRVLINSFSIINAADSVTIGDDATLGPSAYIFDSDHNYSQHGIPLRSQGHTTRPVRIGRDVWIGAGCVVLRGVTIGDEAIVGAGAVVTKNLPSGCIAVGVPARVVGTRHSEQACAVRGRRPAPSGECMRT